MAAGFGPERGVGGCGAVVALAGVAAVVGLVKVGVCTPRVLEDLLRSGYMEEIGITLIPWW